jgi:polar amino acid transport system substrate-binding protein
MKILLAYVSMILLFFAGSLRADDKLIRVRADIWSPYNCDPLSSLRKGSMIDILKLALEPAGYKVHYDVMSWEESLQAGRDGEIEAVVGLNAADSEGFVRPAELQGAGVTCFYGKKDGVLDKAGIEIKTMDQLKTLRLIVPQGYTFSPLLQEYVDKNKDDSKKAIWVESSWPLIDIYKAVLKGQAEMFPENESVLNSLLKSLGIRGGGQVKSLGCTEGESLYVGFSKKHAKASELADLVSKKMKELRKSGELERLLAKYGQTDWSPDH